MRRVLADDAEAFSAIYDRHARSVYGLAHRMLRERSAAEDVAQEAFIALWRSRHSYRAERGSPGGWLLTITRNRAIDAIRRGRAHLHVELDADEEAPERTDGEALRRIEANTIGVALSTLPEAQRQALELSYFDGLSQTEISARLGLPLGTVKGRMRLALRKLAAELGSPAADSLPLLPGSGTVASASLR
jgi:RNA polymerase sigma-70 factor, ECF subfamily